MNASLKALLFFLVFTGCKTFSSTSVNITCTTDASAPVHTSSYIAQLYSPATSGTLSSCLKVPITLTILVSYTITSIAVFYYFGISDMVVALTLPLLKYVAFDKLTALFFLAGMAYWLKSCVLEQIPYGRTMFFYCEAGEQIISISIRLAGKGVIFLFDGLGSVVELSLDFIEALITRFFSIIFFRSLQLIRRQP